MKNSKTLVSTIVRHVLSLIGVILIAQGLISETFSTAVMGASMSILGIILTWNVEGKTKEERINGLLRHIMILLSAISVEFPEWLTATKYETITDIVQNYWILGMNVIMFVWSRIEKK